MKKVLITERQKSLLKENGMEVYHDQSTQYQDKENLVKKFYTRLMGETTEDGLNIFLDISGQILDNHYYVNDENTYLDVEWEISFNLNDRGVRLVPMIKSAKGVVEVYNNRTSDRKIIKIEGFRIITSNMLTNLEDIQDLSYHLTYALISLDNKTIEF